jgi:hypothetical protein
MRNKPLLTLLSTATLSALAALSVPATLVAAPALPAAKAVAKDKITNNAWIVQLAEKPVSAYTGGIKGLQATRPGKGQKIDPNSPAVVNYMAFLESRQNEVLAKVGGGKKLYDYVYTFNGFAAKMSPGQAAKMAARKGVVAVTPDEAQRLDTSSTPEFLGLRSSTGKWTFPATGEGVIVGIIDGGIWPESLSFADRDACRARRRPRVLPADPRLERQVRPRRAVQRLELQPEADRRPLLQRGLGRQRRHRRAAARGSTTRPATSAATAPTPPRRLPATPTSPPVSGGVRQRSAASRRGPASPPTRSAGRPVAGGTLLQLRQRRGDRPGRRRRRRRHQLLDLRHAHQLPRSGRDRLPVRRRRRRVRRGLGRQQRPGVLDGGPSRPVDDDGRRGHPRPRRPGHVTLGNGATYTGASLATAVGPAPLVDSVDAGLPGANATEVALCYARDTARPRLDPAVVAGKIVVCDRGVIARTSQEPGRQGRRRRRDDPGEHPPARSTPTSTSSRRSTSRAPTVPPSRRTRHRRRDGNDQPGGGRLRRARAHHGVVLVARAACAAGGDLLKPDIIAPGRTCSRRGSSGNAGRDFDLYSGTSMSSPHVAGLAAL